MPTGYTADVGDGKITEFNDFAWRCARAFGALLNCSLSAQIELPKASRYHRDELAKYHAKLREFDARTDAAHIEEARNRRDHVRKIHDDIHTKNLLTRERYETMLTFVRAWQPPTSDHVDMKRFMAEQLQDSIRFDCYKVVEYSEPPMPEDIEAWKLRQRGKLLSEIAYHEHEASKEADRTTSFRNWILELARSIGEPTGGFVDE